MRALTSSSNLLQRLLCAGSAAAEEGRPDSDNEDSKEGDLLHECDAKDITPDTLKPEQKDVLRAARKADEDIFMAVREQMLIGAEEEYTEGRECEFWLRKGFKSVFPGHCDRWRYYPARKILIIIDKKFGRIEVTSADMNEQLRSYAVMGAEEMDADHVFVAINQPRLPLMQRITIGKYTRESIAAAKEHLLSIYDGAHNPDGSPRQDVPRTASEDACRYCKAKLDCDAHAEKFGFLAPVSAEGKDSFVGRLYALKDHDLDRVIVACRFAALIWDAAKDEALKRIESGGMVNYVAVPGSSTSTITDYAKAVELLRDAGLPTREIIQPRSLEHLQYVYLQKNHGSAQSAQDFIRKTLEPVTEKKPNSPTLRRLKETATKKLL